MSKRPLKLVAIALLVTLSITLHRCAYAENETTASQAIGKAEESIMDAYKAVAEAEEAGAKVEAYTLLLNKAINLTDQAKLANKETQYAEAERLANQAIEICNQITDEAKEAREKAVQESASKKTIFIALGLATALITTFCAHMTLKWWRNRKEKRKLRMRIKLKEKT